MIKRTFQIALMVFLSTSIQAKTLDDRPSPATLKVMHTETDSFKVSGNCGMCKRTIEGALKDLEGVVSATWDVDSKMILINYNPHHITLPEIKQKIADVGYDTDTIKAKKADYDGLPGCCQYER